MSTTAEKTPATRKTKKAYAVPKGYQLKWPHAGHDLLQKKANAKVEGPSWYVACNAHGDLHPADTAREAEALGTRTARQRWCKGDHGTPAKKAPAGKKA